MQKVRAATLAMLLVMSAWPVVAQGNAITLSLNDASQIQPRNVTVEAVRYGGSEALGVRQTLRIEVSGATARFYVGGAAQPALIVRDLKRGPDAHGTVGLFVGIGADGHFRNLSVRPQ